MKLWKRILSAGLATILAASLLAGCSADFGNSDSSESETGGYVETDYGVPALESEADNEDFYSYIEAMSLLSDGTIRVLMSDDSELGYSVLDSADGGQTWSEASLDITALESVIVDYDSTDETEGKYGYLDQAAFDSEGDLFFTYYVSEWSIEGDREIDDSTTSYYLLTADGVLTEISMEIPGIPNTSHQEYEYIAEETGESDITSESGSEADGESGSSGESEEESESGVTSEKDESSDSSGEEGGMDSSDDDSTEDDDDDSVTINSGSEEGDDEEYNDIGSLLLLDAENLYVMDFNSVITHLSLKDGSVISTIEDFDWVNEIVLSGNRLLVLGMDSVYEYDTETDSQTATHDALYDAYMDSNSFAIAGRTKEDGTVYYACTDGIYSYDLDSDTSEQVMDGSATSLNSSNCNMEYFMAKEDGSFLVWYTDFLTDGMESTLLNYSYSAEAATDYEAELTIYVLAYDSYSLDTLVSFYRKEHPNVKVTIEYGYSDDDAVTASDALRTLNTEIMAGDGPDLILLDGMDVDTYIDNGLLLDLSETVQPMIDSGELFPDIAGTYTAEDGAIYAVPLTFTVPAIVGDADILSQINSLSDYAAAAEAYAATEEGSETSLLYTYDLMYLVGTMMSVNAGTWFAEDGTLIEENLTEYLAEVKKIYQAAYSTLSEENQEYYDEEASSLMEYMDDTTSVLDFSWDPAGEVINIMGGDSKIELGNLSYSDGLEYIASAQRAGENITYKLMPGTMENVYVPSLTLGISSKSEQQEAAVELLSYLLGADGQEAALEYLDGYPVNTAAFDVMMTDPNLGEEWYDPESSTSSMGIVNEDGTEIDLDLYWPTEEQIAAFMEMINGLDTPAYTDDTILMTIMKDCYACVTGDEVSVEDAVAQVVQDLSIYLSE